MATSTPSKPSSATKSSSYNIGESAAVLSYFEQRNLKNIAYLVPHVTSLLQQRPVTSPNTTFTLLDVGCGPGTITLDFARLLAPYSGRVVGLDISSSALSVARQAALAANITNVTFIQGSLDDLHASAGLLDSTFDIVHAHQVLIHLSNPLAALQEMRRVCQSGGLVASRDAFTQRGVSVRWPPPSKEVQAGIDAMLQYVFGDGRDPEFGKRLLSVALEAGFRREDVEFSVSTDLSVTTGEKRSMAGITVSMAQGAAKAGKGVADEEMVETLRKDVEALVEDESAWSGFQNGEIVCRVRK